MKGVERVEATDEMKSNWQRQDLWSKRSWTATVTEAIPDKRIAWTSEGAKGSTKGVITFHRLDDDLTKVLLVLEYYPGALREDRQHLAARRSPGAPRPQALPPLRDDPGRGDRHLARRRSRTARSSRTHDEEGGGGAQPRSRTRDEDRRGTRRGGTVGRRVGGRRGRERGRRRVEDEDEESRTSPRTSPRTRRTRTRTRKRTRGPRARAAGAGDGGGKRRPTRGVEVEGARAVGGDPHHPGRRPRRAARQGGQGPLPVVHDDRRHRAVPQPWRRQEYAEVLMTKVRADRFRATTRSSAACAWPR